MRTLHQVERGIIRCIRLKEKLNFKPLLLFKQLIRWFGYTPIIAVDRVLTLLLELLRSEYGNEVVRKITYERLCIELEKVMKILNSIRAKEGMYLMKELQNLVMKYYNSQLHFTDTETTDSTKTTSISSRVNDAHMEFDLYDQISDVDYECAWTHASLDDLATIQILLESLRIENITETELQSHLIQLQVKMQDYPAEFFLQSPQLFLQLLHVQKEAWKNNTSLLQANRALLTFVKQLRERILIRQNILCYVPILDSRKTQPRQLRVPIALGLLLNSCLKILSSMLFTTSSHNWHLLELILEIIQIFNILNAPVSLTCTEVLSLTANRLIAYCHGLENSDMSELVDNLMMPRLQSLILNGLLQDVVALNITHGKGIDRMNARYFIQPILMDSSYLFCFPHRRKTLSNLISALGSEFTLEHQQLAKLQRAYSLALSQLQDQPKLTGSLLLQVQSQLCLVITQMGSEALVKQLFHSIIDSTPLFESNKSLRKEAESLLSTLLDLPDDHLKSTAFRLMAQSVVQHFHAIVNKSKYLPGCNNLDLVRQHILGLPLNSVLLRKLLFYSWAPTSSKKVQQCCTDYLTMLLKLYSVINKQDFQIVCRLTIPEMPLMVCRSANLTQLHNVLWHILEPDSTCLEPLQMFRGNLCYMFHPNLQLRKEATTRIIYTLRCQDYVHNALFINNLSPDFFGPDLCLVQPPMAYANIFTESSVDPLQEKCSVKALVRLLQTADLRASIRRSTFVQLNFVLHKWEAIDEFVNFDDSYRPVLDAILSPLTRDYNNNCLEIVLPAVSIFMKLLCHSADFRSKMSKKFEVYVCLMRVLLLSHSCGSEPRREVSACLFLLLFHIHITTNRSTMVLNADLGDMLVPIKCTLNAAMPLTIADEGLFLEKKLIDGHFAGNAKLSAQHWRLHIAHCAGQSPTNITLKLVENLKIRDTLKLKVKDLALLQASLADVQLQRQLLEASNCSDNHSLEQIVGKLQTMLVLLRTSIFNDKTTNLWLLIHKYIGLVPGTSVDRRLYILFLQLCLSCLQQRNKDVLSGITEAISNNPHHTFTTLLQDRAIGLDMMYLICQCLVNVIQAKCIIDNSKTVSYYNAQQFYGQYFRQLSALARQHFELRQLEHVRCLLGVLRTLSDHTLSLDVTEVKSHALHFIQLSSDLLTSTQTGSQWQRDCLYILAKIQTRDLPLEKVLRYLLSLCGHSDAEVRALAWVSMANCLSNVYNQDIADILNRLDFLPGGLPACCLTTMLDVHELMLVRALAGRVFIELIPLDGPDATIELMHRHDFLSDALSALKSMYINSTVTVNGNLVGQQNSCEVIGCYIDICLSLVKFLPSWAANLCKHGFVNALSEVLKMPTSTKTLSKAYIELCSAQICEFYTMMYVDNFEHLQKTVCQDPVFIEFYLRLYNEVLDLECPDGMLVHLLKLFLVMCKDDNAYLLLFEQLKKQQQLRLDIFLYGLHLSYCTHTVQRYTLIATSMVCSKVQTGSQQMNFVTELENYVLPLSELLHSDDQNIEIAIVLVQNMKNSVYSLSRQISVQQQPKAEQETHISSATTGVNCTNGAVLLYYRLDRLFERFFPVKSYNFLHPPSMGHVQVCVALGGLLKLSPWAVHAAKQLKLLDRVFQLFDSFLNDSNIGSASVYVRRVGAHKCRDILSNLLVVVNMMAKWHSSLYAVITEPTVAINAVRLLIRIWPWLSHSALLKQITVQLAMFYTEHSLEMCKQTSLVLPGQSHSLLQLMVRVAHYETTRKDAPGKDDNTIPNPNLVPPLRVMMNCCSCSEGRLALSKMHVLDMFDTILPATYTPNLRKIRPHVVKSWLDFWECYSRYDVGARPCRLHGLLNAVRHLPPMHPQRLLCLRIFRNMCFLSGNQAHFVNFVEFLNLLRDIIAQSAEIKVGVDANAYGSFEEQRLVVLMLWKLFCFGAKYKAMLRGTKLLKYLIKLRNHLDETKKEFPEKFINFPYAESLSKLLINLFESLQE
ncbi:protein rotatin homolog isoform X1 [Drosophila tropicalis]|uniref:protein rotatin homolog isoform X1 n=2 Tax=Drosophila tropicalis TaxID=46794 RepID=UPI0035AB96E3